jgi:large subunit ribosomal protein L9
MKVILTSRVKKLGEIGDIKEIADGYGKNYLLPKKLAMIYSARNYEFFEKQKENIIKISGENKNKALQDRDKIEAKDIIILENAGDNDKLYGSINSVRIADFVNKMIGSKNIRKNDIVIPVPIKYLGQFEVIFNLHPEVTFTKQIIVARTKEEAGKVKKAALGDLSTKKESANDTVVTETKRENAIVVEDNTEKTLE